MNKRTNKHNKHNKTIKNKTIKYHKLAKKDKKKYTKLPNRTPKLINELSILIKKTIPKKMPSFVDSVAVKEDLMEEEKLLGSYSPTVNKELVLLQSIERQYVSNCNNELAYKLKEPLQIGIPGNIYGKTCYPYYSPEAVRFLLKNLSANKHVDPSKIVPPIQSQSNCWFNTMFVVLFVSDKGRKFFHFFRQLMIEGKQSDGSLIPSNLRNGFALLNYAIESCLSGNKFAYILDTNAIIRTIYNAIPNKYKEVLPYITPVDEAGNPMRYYGSLISYLHNKSLEYLFIKNGTERWLETTREEISKRKHLPHFIILEIYDGVNRTAGPSGKITNKARSFNIKGGKYVLDSCVIRDTSQQHFSSVLTCETTEMAYDGLSYHRLVPLEWKKYINSDYSWGFEGSNDLKGKALKWDFLHGYQMLIYYRSE